MPTRKYTLSPLGARGRNCNGKKDELDNKPLSEFVCSFQVEGQPDECEKSMEELPDSTERIPLCEKLENPVFEACYPLVDVEIYIEACSFDAIHSGDQKVAFCKTAKEYARQCCQAGMGIEDWLEVFDCDVKCPGDLEYSQCREGCPQTCSSAKNESEDSTCNQLKNDGCFCPEGKVLNDTTCLDVALCDTCDEAGHVPGDEWKEGKCKTCHCRSDLTTECVVEVCPANPICSIQETLAKISHEKEESCCESYTCVPKIQNCPTPVVPECKKGEVAKIQTRKDLCTEFECECDPMLCSPIVWPTDLEEGQVAEIVNDSCCRKVQVSCHENSCPEKPECRKGLELIEMEGECCTTYKCKPPREYCVYTNNYKVEDGFEILLDKDETTPSLHKPGDEWEDGLCEKCKCAESRGQHAPLCTVEQCPALESMTESKCVASEQDSNVYEAGEQWGDPDDPCVNYVCEPNEIEKIQKTKSLINCTECPRTAVYFPPSKILGQCCGICQVTKCEDGDELYEIGDTWFSPDEPCRKAECVKEHGTVKTIYTKQSCPTIPEDCPKDKIVWDEKKCCETCNATSEISCNSAPIPEEDTIGLFTFPDDSHGGTCVNEKPVPNVLICSGACHSQSYYSLEDGDFKDMCKCCKVNVTINRTIELVCPDRNYITKTFLQPETCQCSKCAPKTKPEIEKYETKQTWEQSQTSDESNLSKIPLNIGQQTNFRTEKETHPFQQLDLNQEVQQQHQDYDMFERQKQVQQQHEDYDDMFERQKQVQQQQEDYDDLFD
ncbi:hemocytin [Nephila pilipes]|uniref:Hemocytin n=1 Tax=Nephila pilipes TaxID=299642 RepID=A0A8X6P5R0_NEPPI|nr:hemocytin [Nephila pilipes]